MLGFNPSVNRFRAQRGRILQAQILETARVLGREIEILDVGGRAEYWTNVGTEGISRIIIVNTSEYEFSGEADVTGLPPELFEHRIGDARRLVDFADASVDLVHSNSVIEHVGGWPDIQAMAREVQRVGRTGWIQTPALEFPVEPHFHLPIVHWLGRPLQAAALKVSPLAAYRQCSIQERRDVVAGIRLLSRRDMATLFGGCEIYTEKLIVPKSYVARWRIAA